MPYEPSNRDLANRFDRHAEDDGRFQDEQRKVNVEMGTFKAEAEGHFADLQEILERIEGKQDAQATALEPLTQVYQGVLFSRKFVVGLSTVIIAIGAIGAGFIWLINSVIQKP